MVNHLKDSGVTYRKWIALRGLTHLDRLWLDVEGQDTRYWSTDKNANRRFIDEMVAAGKALNQNLAIYTGKNRLVYYALILNGHETKLLEGREPRGPVFDSFSCLVAWCHYLLSHLARQSFYFGARCSFFNFQPRLTISSWTFIAGDYRKYSDMLLWYARYDYKTNFDDFPPFAGWTKPYMKQWLDNTNICGGTGADFNWRPSFWLIIPLSDQSQRPCILSSKKWNDQ